MNHGEMVPCYRASAGAVSTLGPNPHEAFWHLVRRLRLAGK